MLQTFVPASASHNPLIPEVPEIVWSAIVIALLFAIILKLIYPRYVEIMNERANKIESGLANAEQAEQKTEQAQAQAQATIRLAHEEATQIRNEAQESAKRVLAEAKERAGKEAERIVQNAQRQIEAERQAAEITLKTDVGLLATELAQKIVGEQLQDRELSARVVDRFLDQLEATARSESESVKS